MRTVILSLAILLASAAAGCTVPEEAIPTPTDPGTTPPTDVPATTTPATATPATPVTGTTPATATPATPTPMVTTRVTIPATATPATPRPTTMTPATTTPATPTPATTTPATPTTPTPGNLSVPPSQATFIARENGTGGNGRTAYSFDGPDTVRDGWVTLHLQNQGTQLHQLAVWKLGDTSYASFVEGLSTLRNGSQPSTNGSVVPMGGVGVVAPGGNGTAVVRLEPGSYALVSLVPGSDGTPQGARGMVKNLTVVKGTGSGASEPLANMTLVLRDHRFDPSRTLEPGRHVVKVMDMGREPHEATLFRLSGNATVADLLAALEGNGTQSGRPPIEAAYGGAPMMPGQTQYFHVDVRPGNWAFVCFVKDEGDGTYHHDKGMVHEFEVE